MVTVLQSTRTYYTGKVPILHTCNVYKAFIKNIEMSRVSSMKAILISRVSTEEQKEMGHSLPAQEARLEKYCQSKGFTILKSCSFDESAYKSQRDEFDTILDFVLEQKEKVAVCFDKVDRLTRDTFDRRIGMLYDKALRDELELLLYQMDKWLPVRFQRLRSSNLV